MNRLRRWFTALRQATPSEGGPRFLYIPVRSTAGVRVDHDNALQYSAVWGCVRIIAETISALPWTVFERVNATDNRRRGDLPLDYLLDVQPNPETDAGTWRETLLGHCLTWGNGFAEIERDMAGRITALWQITPDRVSVVRASDGRIVYEISNQGRGNSIIEQADMFHLRGLGYDGMQGYSVIGLAAQSIGLGVATERFGSAFFGNNAIPGVVLEHPGSLSDTALAHLRDSWEAKFGGPGRAHRPAILEEGMKVSKLGLPPEDAQFLETRQHQILEICRWFRVPPHKLADLSRATFSNIEHQSIEFVQDTLLPWTRRLEREAAIKLFGHQQRGRLFTKINLRGLLRGDDASRADYYERMRNMGVLSVNEIRALEDMNGIGPDGDKRIAPLNMTTLEQIGNMGDDGAAAPPGNGADPDAGIEDFLH